MRIPCIVYHSNIELRYTQEDRSRFDLPRPGEKNKEENMLDLIRKGMLAGLGIAYITKEKVMEATRELVEKGKLSRAEAEALANDLIDEGGRQRQEIEEKIEDLVRRGFDRLDIGSKKAFVDVERRLENVEKRLDMVEDQLGSVPGKEAPVEQ